MTVAGAPGLCDEFAVMSLIDSAVRRLVPVMFALVAGCGGGTADDDDDGGEPAEMTCAPLPAGQVVLRGTIEADPDALAIRVVEEGGDDCVPVLWSGTLRLPKDVAPGTYDLSEALPSLYVKEYALGNCMGNESHGVDLFATGTVKVLSVGDCVAAQIDAETVDEFGGATPYRGAFAFEP